jgi:hypothetical protein
MRSLLYSDVGTIDHARITKGAARSAAGIMFTAFLVSRLVTAS